ncbi:hypothetical protein D3C71_1865520 [compost metagenome]
MEQALDAFIPELLAGLQKGAGDDEGALAREQDIELIDELSHGNVTEHGHADDGPDQPLHGHAATAQSNDPFFVEQDGNELGRNEVRE